MKNKSGSTFQIVVLVFCVVMGLLIFSTGCRYPKPASGPIDWGKIDGEDLKDIWDRIKGIGGTDGADAGAGEFPAGVRWLHGSVESWPVTTRLDARVQGFELRLAYDKAGVWPALRQRARDGGAMNANVWVLVEQGGTLYAGVWDYLRVGQQGKPVSAVRGTDGHLPGPLSNWKPKSGDRLGFMVSGDRRGGEQNVKERSNVSWVVWP